MRRLPTLALLCALACLLLGAGPALAATHHHAQGAATASQTATASAKHSATKPLASAKSTVTIGGKPTTKDGLAVLNDCESHGQLTRTYPLSWLRKAQAMMSPGTAQYSNCSTVLQQAILHAVKPGSGGGGGGGSGTTTIVIIVAVVLVILAALLGTLALRRRRGGGPASA